VGGARIAGISEVTIIPESVIDGRWINKKLSKHTVN